MSDIWADLTWRGLVAESTDPDALRRVLLAGPVKFYVGFDPTAPSLHLGHLVQLLTARRLQLAGHVPHPLVGGATGLIGDPKESGERQLNDPAVVAGWTERIRVQAAPYLDFSGPAAAEVVNNLDWTASLTAVELLRDIGKHFSIGRMLQREFVRTRLAGSGISYTEFSYVLLQSYDFLTLFRDRGITLQLGGSDQWGNITGGADLIRRVTGERVHCLATPLLTKADGTKMGKTEAGGVWLDHELTSPYAFHQFFVNSADTQIAERVKIFSFKPHAEIESLLAESAAAPHLRLAQRAIADEVTTIVHGADAAAAAGAAAQALFGGHDLLAVDETTLASALAETPRVTVPAGAAPGYVELFADSGLVPSRGAARRMIAEGGAYVNNERVSDVDGAPSATDLLYGRWLVLRRGRRNVAAAEYAGALAAQP